MADTMRRITISFKNNKRDIELFNTLINLNDKSADIKNILWNYYFFNNKTHESKKKAPVESTTSVLDI